MIANVVIENIRSFRMKEFTIGKGIVVITGKNGSGKSTVLNAIRYALSDGLDAPLHDLRSLGATKDDITRIYIDVDGLQITKKIVPRDGKLKVTMVIKDKGNTLTFPNLTAAKKYILSALGIQSYQFNNGVFLAQSAEIDMLTRPSTAKMFLVKLYGLDRYSILDKKAKDFTREVESRLSNIDGRISVMQESLEEPEDNIEDLNIQLQKSISKVNKIKEKIAKLQSRKSETGKQHDVQVEINAQRELIVKQLTTIIQSIKKLPNYNKDNVREIESDLSVLKEVRKDSQLTLQNSYQLYQIKHRSVSVIETTKTCPICSRQLPPKELLAIVNKLSVDIEQIKGEMSEYRQTISDSNDLYKELQSNVTNYFNIIERRCNLIERGKEIKKVLSELPPISEQPSKYIELDNEINTLTSQLFTTTTIIDKLERDIFSKKEAHTNYNKLKKSLLDLDIERSELIERKNILITLHKAYSNDGIPKYILESQAHALEAVINKNLEILSGGDMEIGFVMVRDNKEVFEVHVHNKGYWKSFNSLSGGEKKRVTLACSFGLSDFIETPIKWRIGDEIDADLDEDGIRAVKRLVEIKRDNYSQLILATLRPELIDLADQIIYLD